MSNEHFYDKGLYTGWAVIIEWIERRDHASLEALAEHLRTCIQGRMDERLKLALGHMSAMYRTLCLPKNAAKGGWLDTGELALLLHLELELNEFQAALWGHMEHGQPLERVESEAADVSNILAMIVDIRRAVEII